MVLRAALYAWIAGVSFAAHLILRLSARGAQWLSPTAVKIATRMMGLLLAAVAIQFLLKAAHNLKLDRAKPPT